MDFRKAAHLTFCSPALNLYSLPYSLYKMPPLIGYRRGHHKALMKIANSVRLNTIRTLNRQHPASLYTLPLELIYHICQYLPMAETFCLMISCARFWNARTSIQTFVNIQQLLDAKVYPTWDFIEGRFHILRLMEFDKLCGKGIRSFCSWACTTTHPKSSFPGLLKPVNLKFSIEEQRQNCSIAVTRSCRYKSRMIWVGICYEMVFAELRALMYGVKDFTLPVTVQAGGCFSEHVEFNPGTNHLISRFYLGRISDLGLDGFDHLCRTLRLPICPHARIDRFAKRFLRDINPGFVRSCYLCGAEYWIIITSDDMIELHISRYVGPLITGFERIWIRASYIYVNTAFVDNCRAFSQWLDRMYNPETGTVYNGGQFETFIVPRKQKYKLHGAEPPYFQ